MLISLTNSKLSLSSIDVRLQYTYNAFVAV